MTIVVTKPIFNPLCDLLTVMNVDVVLSSIKCLDLIMAYAVSIGEEAEYVKQLDSVNGIEKFDFLMNSQCYEVFKAADAFSVKYLDREEEEL